ncbi:MAG: pyridoxamine kinase [Acidaminococcaceae bacterium]|nr:pyridoxamine kinase [Acidaminococcaceae bacterium]
MLEKVVAIHDLSCVGRCSLTVVIPLLSALGVQVCPLPTAVLSSHSGGFAGVVCRNLTEEMELFTQQWSKNGLAFDSVYTGYLASVEQVDVARQVIHKFSGQGKLVLVDPVMGDDGKPYSLVTQELISDMRSLVAVADIITPNYTEACFLLKKDYLGSSVVWTDLLSWLPLLAAMGPEKVVITGIPAGDDLINLGYEKATGCIYVGKNKRIGERFPGTGDIFASVLLGKLLRQEGFGLALAKAGEFVGAAIEATLQAGLPVREGLVFEEMLDRVAF